MGKWEEAEQKFIDLLEDEVQVLHEGPIGSRLIFIMGKADYNFLQDAKEKHEPECPLYIKFMASEWPARGAFFGGPIGGNWTYEITPTSIGASVDVKHVCGHKIEGNWNP